VDSERFDRQILLFGAAGQKYLATTRVAIVGLGGLGSHVAQQLAYLGVRSFVLIDRDRVSRSNLNRLVGATEEDAAAHAFKVAVAARTIPTIERDASVKTLETSFVCQEGYALIASADIVFGCIDSDAHRLVLNELCQVHSKPYMDIATDTGTDQALWFGGRVLLSMKGEMCLSCKGFLDQKAIRQAFSTEGQREEEARIYGVPLMGLVPGPSVVSLNGILASVAVTEFMVETTGIRPVIRSLEYNGMMGRLTVDRDPPRPDCYYCKGLFGSGDDSNLKRLAAEGWGDIV
jgi:saccharopine dehydrogenase-like NADP-dependent oxidoreductase